MPQSDRRWERPVGVGEALQASSIGHGHIIVLRLMKRALLVRTGIPPAKVQEQLGPVPIEYAQETRDGLIISRPLPPRPSGYGDLFSELMHETTRRKPRNAMLEATRADLYRMAKRLVRDIDASKPASPEHDWYPDGWREAYDLIKNGKPAVVEQEAPPEETPPANPRARVLDLLDYVAEKLKTDYDTVLARIDRTRLTLGLEDEAALMALIGTEAQRAAGGSEG